MSKKKKVMGAAGIAAVALVGGTFAYFSQSTTIDNPFDTAKYGTIVVEDFNPEDGEKWQPGAEVDKDLYVDNTGDRDVVVRVKFEDIWARDGEIFKDVNGADVLKVEQTDPKDGLTETDKSVVHKYFANAGMENWVFNEDDGYFYYKKHLASGESTQKFLDSVKLTENVDMGELKTQYYIAIADTKPNFTEGSTDSIATFSNAENTIWRKVGEPQDKDKGTWTVKDVNELLAVDDKLEEYIKEKCEYNTETGKYELKPGQSIYTAALTAPVSGDKLGYSAADYTLRITVETVQATDVAVKDTFFNGNEIPENLGLEWNLAQESLNEEAGSGEASEFQVGGADSGSTS